MIGEQNSSSVTSMFSNQNKVSQQPSSTTKNPHVARSQEIPSTLNGPPGLLIGEKNSIKATTKTNDISKADHRMPSTEIERMQPSSTLPESPSTLNGPSGLLIGERNFSHLANPAHQPRNEFLLERGNKQKNRFDEKSNYPARSPVAEEPSTLLNQQPYQSIIFNEEYIPNLERRVIINEQFYKDSVFSRLGSHSKT